MEEIKARLNNVADSYQGFVRAVLTYVKKKQSRMDAVIEFMDKNPYALSSDILKYISDQEDFYEDAAYATEAGGIKAYGIYSEESQRKRKNTITV